MTFPSLGVIARRYPIVARRLTKLKQVQRQYRELKKQHDRLSWNKERAMIKWQYCVVPIRVPQNKVHELLNEYGEEGWQLVQLTRESIGVPVDASVTTVAWFKRTKSRLSKQSPQDISHGGKSEGPLPPLEGPRGEQNDWGREHE